jgi:hypothetical protein
METVLFLIMYKNLGMPFAAMAHPAEGLSTGSTLLIIKVRKIILFVV